MNTVKPATEYKLIQALFFIYAFLLMSWIPRFPEIKANLGLNLGGFGTLISTAAIGGVVSLFFSGHLVHKYGIKRVILTNLWIMGVAYFFIVRTDSAGIFLICNIAIGWSSSAYHICINAQGFDAMERVKNLTVSRLHGMWSLGALLTAVFSGFMVNYLSIAWHVGGLAIIATLAITAIVQRLTPVLVKPNKNEEDHLPLKSLLTSFRIDWLVSGGFLTAVFIELSTGDWSAIFAKERLGVSPGLAAFPYVIFMIAIITGRLNAGKLATRFQVHLMVRFLAVFGGGGFLIFLAITAQIPTEHKTIALITTCIAFAFAGIGSSVITPSFFAAANRRSSLPSAVVIGQMGVVNVSSVFVVKAVVAWTAQFTGSLAIALAISGFMLMSSAIFARAVKAV
jgi:MFS family permease